MQSALDVHVALAAAPWVIDPGAVATLRGVR